MVVGAADQMCTAANAKRIARDIGEAVISYEEIPGAEHATFGYECASTGFLQMLLGQLENAKPEEGFSISVNT